MIRLINQTRKANGVPELPVNDALMTAAQACSNQRYTWHHLLLHVRWDTHQRQLLCVAQ